MTDVSRDILKILSNSTLGLTASEIRVRLLAKSLRIPEYEIIKVLSEFRNQGVIRIDRNRWIVIAQPSVDVRVATQEPPREIATWSPSTSLIINPEGAGPGESLSAQEYSGPWGSFRKLMHYYIDCIRCEEGSDAKAYLNDVGRRFVFLSRSGRWFPKPDRLWKSVETSVSLGEFVNAPNLLNDDTVLLLGYPIQFVPFKDGNQVSGAMIKPIFTYRVQCDRASGALRFTCDDPWPDVNLDWLEYAFAKDPEKQRNFLADCGLITRARDGEAIGDVGDFREPDFSSLIQTLIAHMPKESLREVLRVESINGTPLSLENSFGIYNKAIFLIGERPKYTRNLIAELREISSASDETLDGTSLKYVFKNEKSVVSSEEKTHEQIVLEGQDLNFEQRVAVSSIAQRPVTVVTGPPGTGKSQVVASSLLNIRLQGASALFTSRNHKAVDTVIERFNTISSDPLIVRANSRADVGQSFGFRDAVKVLLAEQYDAAAQGKWAVIRAELDDLLKQRGYLAEQSLLVQGLRDSLGEVEKELYEIENRLDKRLQESLVVRPDERLAVKAERLRSALSLLSEGRSKKNVLKVIIGCLRCVVLMGDFYYFQQLIVNKLKLVPPRTKSNLSNYLDDYTVALGKFYDGVRYWLLREKQTPLNEELKNLPNLEQIVSDVAVKNARLKELLPHAIAVDSARRLAVPPETDKAQLGGLGPSMDIIRMNLAADVAEREAAVSQINASAGQIVNRYPLWAVTNLSLSGRIPLIASLFDLAVIDEASQCDIPSAIPVMFRSRRIAVVGDPQQLCHITKINRNRDLFLRKRKGLSQINNEHRFSYVETSLYGLLAQSTYAKPTMLRDTYRSVEEIAEYSNDLFYSGALRVLTSPNGLKLPKNWKPGIQWESVISNVVSVGPSGCHAPGEVDVVLKIIKGLLKDGFDGSIGVVTPFQQQKRRITDSLYCEVSRNAQEVNGLIVDTAHGFQGDQKDVIVLSLCGGPGMPTGSLGFLKSNAYLMNVAVSRARALLIVVGNRDWAAQCGVKHIERLAKPRAQLAITVPVGKYHPHESPWEKILFEALVNRRVVAEPQWPVLGRRLDLALVSKRTGKKIDIEVDGDAYHRNSDGSRKIDDVWRDIMMKADGWQVMRFWVYQLREDLDGCVDKIVREWEA